MAFCSIEKTHRENFTAIVFNRISKNPEELKNFKLFTKSLFTFLTGKGMDVDRAIAFTKYIPQIVSEYNSINENRRTLRQAGVSLDAIYNVEDEFTEYGKLANYLGIKNEATSLIVVNDTQLASQKKMDDLVSKTEVKFITTQEDNKLVQQREVNGKVFNNRVTSIAKAGFDEPIDQDDDNAESPALKHGNTVDSIAKQVFDDTKVEYSEYKDLIDEKSFESIIGKLRDIKKGLEAEGYIFRTGVTVYNPKLSISGEIDLAAISPKGEVLILDFKTANQRFNEPYLKNSTLKYKSDNLEKTILSKWNQYATQGYIYAKLLEDQTGLSTINRISIIGIEIDYDHDVPVSQSKINNVRDIKIHNIPFSQVRSEYNKKSVEEIMNVYKDLKTKSLSTLTEIKPIEKKGKKKLSGDFGTREKLDRVTSINEIAATDSELEQEINWLQSNPIGKNTLLTIDTVVNSGLFGKWTLDGITLYKNASAGTVYHEGWHRFSQIFMDRAQKLDLYESVQNDDIKFTTRDGRKLSTKNASFLDVEEFLAEQFAKFALKPNEYTYPTGNNKPKSLFQRIWDFLLRYFGPKNRPIDIFQKLYRGKVGEYVPSVNNAFWGNLNSIAQNSKGEEIIPNERLILYVETLEDLINTELQLANKTYTSLKKSPTLQKKVLNNVYLSLKDRYENDDTLTDQQNDELFNILENKYDFTKVFLKSTSLSTIKDLAIDENIFTGNIEDLEAIEDILDRYEDVEDINEEEDDSKPERFDRAGNEDSALNLADGALQDFFRSIPKIKGVNKDGTLEYERNELGYKKHHSYYDIFNKTKRMMAGAFTMNDLIGRMESRNNQRLFPELQIINERFLKILHNREETNPKRKIENVMFIQSFYHVMSMPEVPNMQLTVDFRDKRYQTYAPTKVSFKTASRNLILKIIKTWEKNFKDRRNKDYTSFQTFDTNKRKSLASPLYMTEDGKILLNPFANFNKFTNSLTNRENGLGAFFEYVGIEFNPKVFQDPDAVKSMIDFKSKLLNNINIYRNYIYPRYIQDADDQLVSINISVDEITSLEEYVDAMPDLLFDILAKKHFINNPISFFNEKRVYEFTKSKQEVSEMTTSSMRFNFEEMASLEELFGDRVSSGAFRIEDKTKYPYYIPNQLLIITNLLNQVKNVRDFYSNPYIEHLNPEEYSWLKRSYFMQQMFDNEGERRVDSDGKPITIKVQDIASIRFWKPDGTIIEKHPRSLNVNEKFFMDVLTLFKGGSIEIQRSETSSTIFTTQMSSYGIDRKGNNKILPLTITEVANSIPESFYQIVKDYFAAEIEKRQWFMKNDPNVKGVISDPVTGKKLPLARQFNIFQGILSPELRGKVEQHLDKTPEDIFLQEGILSDFRKEIKNYFDARFADIMPKFDSLSTDQKTIIRDTASTTTTKSIAPIAKAFVLNRFILNQEFQNLYFGDLYYYKNPYKRGKYVTNTGSTYYIDEERNDMLNNVQFQTLNSAYTGKKAGGKDFTQVSTAIMEDFEIESAYTDNDQDQNIILNDIIKMRIESGSLVPGTQQFVDFVNKTTEALDKYKKINVADGQGIIGLDFYRNFSIITKIWSPEKEDEYNRQIAIFRNHYGLYNKLDENGNKISLEGEELDAARRADQELIKKKTNGYFNPLKLSYTGPQVKDGPTRPVFDKFSVRPIIPEAAIGKRDENLLMRMIEKDIDYVKFQSGSKIYQDSVFQWFKKVNGKYALNDYGVEEIDPNHLHSAYLKHQLSTEEIKDENILGSQFRKIVFGIKYSPNVINNPQLFQYFSNLEKEFFAGVSHLLEVEQADLFSLLGINEQSDGSYKIDDMQKFLKLLTNESVKRGIAINNIDYIKYNEATKGAQYPIDYAFNRQQIQDLLSGLIDERLRRLKINGSSLIQVSSAGYENKTNFTNATVDDIKKYGTTGLHYYHVKYDKSGKAVETSTMGIKVGFIKEYERLLDLPSPDSLPVIVGGKIGTLARLNQAMKDEVWKKEHMDKFIMIGYRIPTQNNNFIDRMEVMEFLPSSAGGIIIPPPEIVVKSGSDFDIDKMNVIIPNFGPSGEMINAPKETLDEITKEIAKLTFEERDIKIQSKEIGRLISTAKGDDRINRLLEQQKKIRLTILDLAMKNRVHTSIIDKIMENISNGENVIIPTERQITEEEAFPNAEEDLADVLSATIDYMRLDEIISKHLDSIEGLDKEKKRIDSQDMLWFNKKKKYKNAVHNGLLKTLSKTISHPYYFELLVTPSSTSMFDNMTNELISSQERMTLEEYNEALLETDGKLYDSSKSPEENSRYTATLEAFENLLSKRKDLGAYAIQRTFADVFNFIKFSIAKSYTVKSGKELVTKVIHTPLVSPEDRSKLVKDGRILMHGDSVNGIPIKNSFDELISLTVDLANSPAYPRMGINEYNKKYVQYLFHQKVDPKQVLWFINQPILKNLFSLYEKNRSEVEGYSLKHAITELALKNRILDNPKAYETGNKKKYELYHYDEIPAQYDFTGEKKEGTGVWIENRKKANTFLARPYLDLHNQNLTDIDFFSFEDMDASIRGGVSNEVQNLIDDFFGEPGHTKDQMVNQIYGLDTSDPKYIKIKEVRDKIDEIEGKQKGFDGKIISYFASITDEVDSFMGLEFANNVDTNKYSTLTSIIRNRNNRRNTRNNNLFDIRQLDKLEKESMIAPFDYTKKAYGIQKALFPKLYTNKTIQAFTEIIDDIWGVKNVEIERISKIIENDYIEFVYKNYGEFKGKNLSDYFEPSIINTDFAQNHEYFSYRFQDLVSQYEELKDIFFISNLSEDIYNPPLEEITNSFKGLDNKEIHNLFLLRNPDNPTMDKNTFTDNWRNLINFDPNKLGLKKVYSQEDTERISSFFHELVYFSLYQAGLTNTGNGFSDLIPYEYWAHFAQNSFDRYDEAKKDNEKLETEMLRMFILRFKQMNPKIKWRTKNIVTQEIDQRTGRNKKKEIEFYKNYYRGKDYKVTDDDLTLSRDTYLYTDDELEDGGEVNIPTPEPVQEAPKFEQGRYVRYKDQVYIITKPIGEGKWQIYNPLMEGAKSKLTVLESNLTVMKERAVVVEHVFTDYMVTAKNEIISMTTMKKMSWPKDHKYRVSIIQKAIAARKQLPKNNLGDNINNTEC